MNIIGISGFAGSGKDTVADILLENPRFVKVSVADPLKRIAKELWGFTDQQLWGSSEYRNTPDKRYPVGDGIFLTPRNVLQHLGTEGCRAVDHDVWIRYTINVARKLLTEKGRWSYSRSQGLVKNNRFSFKRKILGVVIADVRFNNELFYIKESEGKLIRVYRPNAGLDGDFATHQSESEMTSMPDSEFDFVIENTGSLDDLKRMTIDIALSIYSNR